MLAQAAAAEAVSLVPQRARDKLYITLFFAAMIAGLYFSLASPLYLLGFNANTLMISGVIFTVCSANWVMKARPVDEQAGYAALCLIPIALRAVLQLPFFGSWGEALGDAATWQQQVGYALQVAGLWLLVSVAEEAFRAALMNLAEVFQRFRDREINLWWRALFANSAWILFHFVQRPFDPWTYRHYIVWLFISGLVMTYALVKAGLGASVLIHLLTNLTA